MHLAIDLRILDAPDMEMSGVGRYALEITRALQAVRPIWRFSLFSNRPNLLSQSESTAIYRTRVPTHRAIGRVLWLHFASMPSVLRARPDAWFSPSFVLPMWWSGPSIVTIHDLTFLLLRHRYRGGANSLYATVATRWSAQRAGMVLCPSEATRKLVVENFAIDPHKTAVTHEGIAEVFFAKPASPIEHSVTPARPYLLFVGTWEARKGIRTLLEACRRVNSSGARVDLVLAGKPGWRMGEMLDALRGEPNVTLIERPSDDQLARLYRSALALVYPSEMEGFGLPVAEAMACGCPVIATDLPSIREFAGDCPLYIRAGDSGALARHVGDLLAGGPQLDARREAGRGAVAWLRWREIGEHAATLIENA